MSLTFKKKLIRSSNFNGESTLPSVYGMSNVQNMAKAELDEDDGLFIGYGFLDCIFPYRMQDLYDRSTDEREYMTVELENDYLKAVFIPDLGGRLWSLYDKKAERDLLFENSIVRPCNLALRNAWCSGGVEFNIGMVGHSPFTCSRIFTAETKLDDGTPVLRMYEFERIRKVVYQMDFFLPDDSPLLYARMRIVNPNAEVTPMYWWSNIAVEEARENRNVINAHYAYNNSGGMVQKNPVPIHNGIDVTYPKNNPIAIDYFWKINDEDYKFTSNLNAEGYGLVQASTKRLQGRKLFVWGQGYGSDRWNEFLTEDGSKKRYVEIQAGLAHSQYECLPMPPKTAWEWMEVYGAMNADAEKVHGDWNGAIAEVKSKLEAIVTESELETKLVETKKMALTPAEKLIFTGSGWGKLENIRRERAGFATICPHLDFGNTGKEQAIWLELLENGSISSGDGIAPPESWMFQREWTEMLERAEPSQAKHIHLAAIYLAERNLADAKTACRMALAYGETPTALFLMSEICRREENATDAAKYAIKASKMLPGDISFARQALTLALDAGCNDDIVKTFENAPENVKADGRAKMLYAYALVRSGDISGAESVLYADGGLLVTDVREAEVTTSELYVEIEVAKAAKYGREIDKNKISIPRRFDYRMFAERED